jgi:hypothetical protein
MGPVATHEKLMTILNGWADPEKKQYNWRGKSLQYDGAKYAAAT